MNIFLDASANPSTQRHSQKNKTHQLNGGANPQTHITKYEFCVSRVRSNFYFMTIFKKGKCEPMNKDSKVPMSWKAFLNISKKFMNCNTSANRILKPNKIVD
jgi:hypothetical protein